MQENMDWPRIFWFIIYQILFDRFGFSLVICWLDLFLIRFKRRKQKYYEIGNIIINMIDIRYELIGLWQFFFTFWFVCPFFVVFFSVCEFFCFSGTFLLHGYWRCDFFIWRLRVVWFYFWFSTTTKISNWIKGIKKIRSYQPPTLTHNHPSCTRCVHYLWS